MNRIQSFLSSDSMASIPGHPDEKIGVRCHRQTVFFVAVLAELLKQR